MGFVQVENPGSLTERVSKGISKQMRITTFRIDHATLKFSRGCIFPVQINQMLENHLFQYMNISLFSIIF